MRRKRTFHVADILILTALTAVGLALWIAHEREWGVFDWGWQTPYGRSLLWFTSCRGIGFFLLSWTMAFIVLRCRKPRPRLARLCRSMGGSACLTVMIMITVLYAIFFIDTVLLWRSMVLTATEDFMWEILWDPDSFKLWLLASPELDVFPSLRQPAEDMFVSLTQPVEDLVTWAGPGIIAIWALLALSSSLRPKCDCVDAFGFWLGVGWILMVGKPVVDIILR